MGRVNIRRPTRQRKPITMFWNERAGLVTIRSDKPNQRNQTIVVNGDEYSVDYDENGVAEVQLQKAETFYKISIKGESLERAPRLGVFY